MSTINFDTSSADGRKGHAVCALQIAEGQTQLIFSQTDDPALAAVNDSLVLDCAAGGGGAEESPQTSDAEDDEGAAASATKGRKPRKQKPLSPGELCARAAACAVHVQNLAVKLPRTSRASAKGRKPRKQKPLSSGELCAPGAARSAGASISCRSRVSPAHCMSVQALNLEQRSSAHEGAPASGRGASSLHLHSCLAQDASDSAVQMKFC